METNKHIYLHFHGKQILLDCKEISVVKIIQHKIQRYGFTGEDHILQSTPIFQVNLILKTKITEKNIYSKIPVNIIFFEELDNPTMWKNCILEEWYEKNSEFVYKFVFCGADEHQVTFNHEGD